MPKLQSTIDYAFKLCGSIGLFFSFTEVRYFTNNIISHIYTYIVQLRNTICLTLRTLFITTLVLYFTLVTDYNESALILLTCVPNYSLLVYGWPCGTGTRKIHELILVLSSSLTPSPCPLSLHMILLTDGGWFHNVGFRYFDFFQRYSSIDSDIHTLIFIHNVLKRI